MYIQYDKQVLDNGLTIVGLERQTHSVCIDIKMNAGSLRDNQYHGLAHAFEHMLFKGTKTRDFSQISQELEELGAGYNAGTSLEFIDVYAKLPHRNFTGVFDIFTDMMFNSLFLQDEWAREKLTIDQEIKRYSDDLFQFTHDNAMLGAFSHNGSVSKMAHPIIGYIESVAALTPKELKEFHQKFCVPSNTVISVVGQVDFDKFVDDVAVHPLWAADNYALPSAIEGVDIYNQDFSQKSLLKEGSHQSCINGIIPNKGRLEDSVDKAALMVLSEILGGGQSSRYFKKIREEHGMAYSVGAINQALQQVGHYVFYCLYDTKNRDCIIDIVNKEIQEIRENGVYDHELSIRKNNIADSVLMQIEDNQNLARLLSKYALWDSLTTMEEEITVVQQLTNDDIIRAANQLVNAFESKPNNKGFLCTVDPA